jgi:hypothetical protein
MLVVPPSTALLRHDVVTLVFSPALLIECTNFKVFDVMKRPRTTVRFTSVYARDSVRLDPTRISWPETNIVFLLASEQFVER